MASGRLIFEGFQPAASSTGARLSGAKAYVYSAGTTTPVSVFSDSTLATPLSNPVVADSAGQFPGIFVDSAALYDVKVTTSADAQIGYLEDVRPVGEAGDVAFATWTEVQAGSVTEKAIDPATAILGMPKLYRDIICDVRPLNPNADDSGGILAAFNGEQTYTAFALRSRLRTQTILGAPTSGYLYTVEAIPFRLWHLNRAGHNQGTTDNNGRTGSPAMRVNITSTFGSTPSSSKADGDTSAYNFSAFINATQKVGATVWLANPAVVGVNGDMLAGADYVYLNGGEVIYDDGGFDVSMIHDVANMERTNATGGQKCTAIGYRLQSIGTQPIDAGWSARGPIGIGIDLSTATISRAAITLAAGQKIDFNSTNADSLLFPDETVLGGESLEWSAAAAAFQFKVDGNVVQATGGWGSLNSGTTPDISGQPDNIVMIHGSSTTITNFTGGAGARTITLLFTNSNVTLQNGSTLILRGGSNVTPGNNNVITLMRNNVGNWVEVSRNF
jgi:hypothetical protein